MFANNRSTFVTYTAWILIVLTGIGLIIAALQNFALQYYFPGEFPPQEMIADVQKIGIEYNLSAIFIWMILHVKTLAIISLVFIASFFVASIGLLKRLGWARLAVIGLCALAIAYCCLGLYIQIQTIEGLSRIQSSTEIIAGINQGMGNVKIISYAITGVVCGAFGYVIVRLLDDDIANEFGPV